jgi:hypothetical protein
MSDHDIVETGFVQPQSVKSGVSVLPGRRKAQLRGGMERSDEYRLLPSAAKVVISAIWELADTPKGTQPWVHARFKVSTLADRCGLSRSQIHRWLNRIDHRRLEDRVSKGLGPEPDWLGPWVRTWCVKGRFLGVTAFATPGSPEARNRVMDMAKRRSQTKVFSRVSDGQPVTAPSPQPVQDATPAEAPMRQQMPRQCDNDTPPRTSTSTTHPVGRSNSIEQAGGGGDEQEPPNQTTLVRDELIRLGVRPTKADELALNPQICSAGPRAIRATLDAIKASSGIRDPLGTLVHRLTQGQITKTRSLGKLPPAARIDVSDPELVSPEVGRWVLRITRASLSGQDIQALVAGVPQEEKQAAIEAMRIVVRNG